MMESFRIYQVTHNGEEYGLNPVDSVPADSVCTVYIGGNGIVNENRATRLGAIVQREILQNVADIPNYVVMYDALDVADNRPERLVEMDRRGHDVLARTDLSAVIYLNRKNVNDAYRRRVLPLLIQNGPRGFMRIMFAIDGDVDDVGSILLDKIQNTMRVLNFPRNVILSTMNTVLVHCYPYAELAPNYPHDMFEKILKPRISDKNGRRLDMDTALRRVRKLNLLAQCHGGHVVRIMEQAMSDAMRQMGYSAQEIKQIMSQILVTAFAPSCALGNSKFQFISFMSVYDYVVDVPNNWVYRYVSDNRMAEAARFSDGVKNWKWNFPPMFLGGRDGNVFIVKQRFDSIDGPNLVPKAEHNDVHYAPVGATEDGEFLAMLARNVVTNGIKNSLAQRDGFTPLPPVSDLILDGENDAELADVFTAMTTAGDKFMDDVRAYAHEHNIDAHPPRDLVQYTKFIDLKR